MMETGDKYYFYFFNNRLIKLTKYLSRDRVIICKNFTNSKDYYNTIYLPEINLIIEQNEYIIKLDDDNIIKLVPLPKELEHFYE